jgi:transcriptional regulator with XRE-family HTH domain
VSDYDQLIATLRQAWISQGVSQAALAARIGCDRGEVARWLACRVQPAGRRLVQLADALGYDLALVPREDA